MPALVNAESEHVGIKNAELGTKLVLFKQSMATFSYATRTGQLKNFEATDQDAALGMLKGFSDADPKSGVMASQTKKQTPSKPSVPAAIPAQAPITDSSGAIDATKLSGAGSVSMPQPTAPAAQESFQTGVQSSVDSAEANLNTSLAKQRDEGLERQDELNTKLEGIMKESDPAKRETSAQEGRIMQNQLDAAEDASATLEEDFNTRRSTVDELKKLLTQGNQLIERAKSQPIALSVLDKSISQTTQDVQARAGVLQAVLTGLDGNISEAHSIINNAQSAVSASWQDTLTYNEAYMNLVQTGELAKNKIYEDYASSEVSLAKDKLDNIQATSDYLKKLMVTPDDAKFMARAGVSLNDTVDEINEKMAAQSQRDEINDTINDLSKDGYKYVPYAEGRTDVVSLKVGDETLYFTPPSTELSVENVGGFQVLRDATGKVISSKAPSSSGGAGDFDAYTDTERRTITRANLQGASAQTQAAFLSTPPSFQDAFIRNGTGQQYPNPTPENIVNSLAEWEKEQNSDDDSDINALVTQLRGS